LPSIACCRRVDVELLERVARAAQCEAAPRPACSGLRVWPLFATLKLAGGSTSSSFAAGSVTALLVTMSIDCSSQQAPFAGSRSHQCAGPSAAA
jgi:hypothetical protein